MTLLMGLVSLLGVAHMPQTTSDSPSRNSASAVQPDTVGVQDIASDDQISQRLTSVLESTEWIEGVRVESENGVVTLSGSTTSEESRIKAEQLAVRTQDVVSVKNNIHVEAILDFSTAGEVIHSSLLKLWRDFLSRFPLLVAATMIVILTWGVTKLATLLIGRLMSRSSKVRQSLKDLVQLLTSIGTWIVGLLIAAVVAFPGMTPAKALAVLGLGSVAIGFAFKDIFENFFAGVLILWRYPLDRGDFVEVNGIAGKVEEITVRNTMIRGLDGSLFVVPNAEIFKQAVDVLTNRSQRRVHLVCGVSYDTDLELAKQAIEAALEECATVNRSMPIQVLANAFADSSINFDIFWWTDAQPMGQRESRAEVVMAIKRHLDESGIEIPFPQRTLHFANALPLDKASSVIGPATVEPSQA